MYEHEDALRELNRNLPLRAKLEVIHKATRKRFPFIDRIAVALYDSKSTSLKTFIASSGPDKPLVRYESTLGDAPSLQEILLYKRPRVVNDLSVFSSGNHAHTRKIEEQGYSASYTVPIQMHDELLGFLFFNSYKTDCFTEDVLQSLDFAAHLISSLVIKELASIRTLTAVLKTVNDLLHERDPETGTHVERMARFSRVIALELAESGKYNFGDDYIERIFLFASMHDIGKIAIPDSVLKKKGTLTQSEIEIMQSHTLIGLRMVNQLIDNFGFEAFEGVGLLRNIAGYHHERINGGGYPIGLKGEDIPPEARIVAVADVFDALTSTRAYKRAWSNEEAFKVLMELSRTELDRDCVQALLLRHEDIRKIQNEFAAAALLEE